MRYASMEQYVNYQNRSFGGPQLWLYITHEIAIGQLFVIEISIYPRDIKILYIICYFITYMLDTFH